MEKNYKRLILLILLCVFSISLKAQKVYHLVIFELVTPKPDTIKNINTLIFTLPVDHEYYNCITERQIVTNYFLCRNLQLSGLVGNPDWKIIVRKKYTSYE
jgi:hypothetical protein